MYNQPFSPPPPPPPPPPPASSGGGNNTKYILGGLGALGCLGIIGLAILIGVYITYIKKNNNANNGNYVANASPSPWDNSNGNTDNTNGDNTNTSNNNTNVGVGGGMRSRIQQRVGSFRLEATNPVRTAPTYSYPQMNAASQILTNAINGAGAREALLARYTDPRSPTLDYSRVDHRVVTCASQAEANALMERIAAELQGANYRIARRTPTMLQNGQTAGSKIFMETGRRDTDDEVVLWTNGPLFCSAATGKRGNATQFEAGTSY